MKRILLIVMLMASALVTACASVPPAAIDMDAFAKTFTPQPGKANVYVYRSESPGAAANMPINIDSNPAGNSTAQTYVVLEVNPGKYTIASKTENDAAIELMIEAGKNYFVWQEMKAGPANARSRLQLVDEAVGRAGVANCKLVGSTINLAAAGKPEGTVSDAAGQGSAQTIVSNETMPKKENAVSILPDTKIPIQKIEFRSGVSSATVEKLAKQYGCTGSAGAGLITDKGPVEVYRKNCDNDRPFLARCELRQCQPMR